MLQLLVTLCNSVCIILAGFRSFQALQVFAKRGIDERLPTFPEFSDDENENDDSDDGAVGKKNQEEQNLIKLDA